MPQSKGMTMTQLRAGFGTSTLADTQAAVEQAVRAASSSLGGLAPGLAVVTATVEHSAAAVFAAVRRLLPSVLVHGVTTSLGVLAKEGIVASGEGVVGILLFAAEGDIGFAVGYAVLGEDARAAGRRAAEQLGHGPLPPRVLLFNSSPGREEDTLAGIAEVLPDVPAFGGSAADHAIVGEWSVFTDAGAEKDAVSVAALCGDVDFSGALLAPFLATSHRATVTAGHDRRMTSLDGKPAAEVLNAWLDDSLALQLAEGGNILAQTALRPLALRHQTSLGEHYVTIHPAQVHVEDHSIDLFARIRLGDEVCMMSGTVEGLTRVLAELYERTMRGLRPEKVRAAILIYCAGCAGAVGSALHEGLRTQLGRAMGEIPLLGMCTFGEQGYISGLGNVHQDLSVSLLLIAEK